MDNVFLFQVCSKADMQVFREKWFETEGLRHHLKYFYSFSVKKIPLQNHTCWPVSTTTYTTCFSTDLKEQSLAKQVHTQPCSLAVWMSILILVNCRAVNKLPNLTPSPWLNIVSSAILALTLFIILSQNMKDPLICITL